jgi:hypothetical protein
MENITMTRISDLPDLGQPGQGPSSSNNYQPMLNVHPNPYGISQPPSGGLPPPIQTQEGPKTQQNIIYGAAQELELDLDLGQRQRPVNRLPQRDIPMIQEDYTHDEQIHPNYIPKPKLTRDYIDEYQNSTDRKLREYEDKKRVEKTRDSWFEEFRIPAIVGILFFIFSMPIVNTLIFKRFGFLSIYNDDGNFNFSGLVLKSICFGTLFWIMNRGIDYFSEL